eukprot:1830882-Rhodomonas_salina.2
MFTYFRNVYAFTPCVDTEKKLVFSRWISTCVANGSRNGMPARGGACHTTHAAHLSCTTCHVARGRAGRCIDKAQGAGGVGAEGEGRGAGTRHRELGLADEGVDGVLDAHRAAQLPRQPPQLHLVQRQHRAVDSDVGVGDLRVVDSGLGHPLEHAVREDFGAERPATAGASGRGNT